jgi:aminomethyltransferase
MRETPLTAWHKQHRAKMMEFGGYLMPIEYDTGILQEHAAVRRSVGIFDVSHMGEFFVRGPSAAAFLDYLVTNQPSALEIGQALYTPMCYADGGCVDDLLIYRLEQDEFFLVVNAGNLDKDWEWVSTHARDFSGVECRNASAETGLLAVQGPDAAELLQRLVDQDLGALGYYHAMPAEIDGVRVLISRTGYTGEDGFEVYIPREGTVEIWNKIVALGAQPVGLGARDTLRLEARLPLYDHELTPEITPLEAGLGSFVKFSKENFIGREALAEQKAAGVRRRSVGLEVTGGIARAGYPVVAEPGGSVVGVVTSGTKSPTLGQAIALALVDASSAKIGTRLYVQIRGKDIPCVVVKTPFYKRPG